MSLSKAETPLITPNDDRPLLSLKVYRCKVENACISANLLAALLRESRRVLFPFLMLLEDLTHLHKSSFGWTSSFAFSLWLEKYLSYDFKRFCLLFFFLLYRLKSKPEPLLRSLVSLCLALRVLFMASLFFVNRVAQAAQSAGMYRRDHRQAWQNISTVRAFKSKGGREMGRIMTVKQNAISTLRLHSHRRNAHAHNQEPWWALAKQTRPEN